MNDLPHPTTAAATTTTTTETLYDLWERSRQPPPPHDQHWHPAVTESLPWSNSSTTGISFLDAAISWGRSDDSISPSSSSSRKMPTTTTTILDITGDAGTGKTSTLLTYAARFLTRTRRRRQCPPSDSESTIRPSMVILFDNHRNVIHPARSVYDKLYAMIQQQQELRSKNTEMNRHDKENHPDNNNDMAMTVVDDDDDENVDTFVHGEVMECLQRLHIARVDDFSQWVLLLETLRHELFFSPVSPTTITATPAAATILLLWDDFLDDDVMLTVSKFSTTRRRSELAAVAMRMDVIRQLERLLDSGGPMVTLVTTTTTTTTGTTTHHNHNNKKRTIGPEWNRCVTHSIHLERTVASSSVGSSTTADFLGAATITTQQHHHHHHHSTSTLPPPTPPIPFVISLAHGIVS